MFIIISMILSGLIAYAFEMTVPQGVVIGLSIGCLGGLIQATWNARKIN